MSCRSVISDEAVGDVLAFWFDGDVELNYKNKWFVTGSREMQAELDRTISERYGALLNAAMKMELESWRETQEGKIALIVVLDQFSRHIFRHQQLPPDAEERRICDQHALSIAEELTSASSWHVPLSVSEFVFSLMPYRHSATLQRLENVLQCIDAREAVEAKYADLLSKFRKQTTRRLQLLQDRATIESYDGILERHEVQSDESSLSKEALVAATRSFLHARGITAGCDVAVSLSGGVDSMVILKILVYLRSELSLGRIVAIHIDYANRPESCLEADFLESYCSKYDVMFFKRVVDEVRRGITDRAEYEKITRQIRYSFYADVFRMTAEGSAGEYTPCSAVMFGHHQGDVQENVISNIMRGCSPLFLAGMNEVGVTESITVWRPLLSFHKTAIYDFAHRYGVPYFRDTTPSWSTRGKLRNMLVPLLVDMYGEGCLRNISSLAAESDETREMVHLNLYAPFLATVQKHKCGLVVNVNNYKTQPLCFWKLMLKELMHSMSMSLIRERAVANFLERLEMDSCYGSWIELRKGYASYLDINGDLMLFRDGVLVYTDDRVKASVTEESVSYPLEIEIVSGKWCIVSTIVSSSTHEKVLIHPHELLQGSFEYNLQTTATSLRMTRLHGIKKKGLYPSLSSVDAKIQKELNFLVPDESTSHEDAPIHWLRIRYDFIGDNI